VRSCYTARQLAAASTNRRGCGRAGADPFQCEYRGVASSRNREADFGLVTAHGAWILCGCRGGREGVVSNQYLHSGCRYSIDRGNALNRTCATFWDVMRPTEARSWSRNVIEAADSELFDVWVSRGGHARLFHQFVSVSVARVGDQTNPCPSRVGACESAVHAVARNIDW
jgi:hypothetical protein